MISQEEEKKKTEISRQKKKKDYPPLRHFGDSQNSKNKPSVTDNKFSAAASENSYPVQVFSGGYGPSQLLLNAIPRRNDTFYVLSFSTVRCMFHFFCWFFFFISRALPMQKAKRSFRYNFDINALSQ